jgi:hypothetical protein
MPRLRDPLATHNERVKLRAQFLNALAIGFLGFSFVRPLVEGTLSVDVLLVGNVIAGLVLHRAADYILKYLETED